MIDNGIQKWLLVILEERFGLNFLIDSNGCLCLSSNDNKTIEFPNLFDAFYQIGKPDFSISEWSAEKEGWESALDMPLIILGDSLEDKLITLTDNGATIEFDILGLVYWCLSRSEEVNRQELDLHSRFIAKESHAYQYGYLERPIVDEWLYLLGQVIERVWPDVVLKKHIFEVKVSHDVDAPSQFGFVGLSKFIRRCGRSVIIDKNIKNIFMASFVRFYTKDRLIKIDAYNSFDWIMNLSEKYGLTSAFYFICGRTDIHKDSDYSVEHPAIRNLMREIYQRGHEIGLHPSYNTYSNTEAISSEFETLKQVCIEESISQRNYGGRMHYLRWKHPYTMQAWNDIGLSYDSTMTYADHAGFRCGTCFEYPAINPVTHETLNLRIRPLVAMECSIISYMKLGLGAKSENKFIELAQACRKVNGCFTMLWHNSEFSSMKKRSLYGNILGQICTCQTVKNKRV